MKRIILISFIFITQGYLFAQEKIGDNAAYHSDDTTAYFSTDFNPEEIEQAIKKNPLQFNVEIGTSFGTGFGNGSYFGSYIAPEVNYSLSPRFSLGAGARVSSGFPIGVAEPYYGNMGLLSGNINRTFIYAKGAYQLSENLRVTGAVYKEVNVFNNNSRNYPGANFDYQGVIMGVDYKVGKNMFIHGVVEFSNGSHPNRFYQDPFHNRGFQPSPFNTMNSGPF